MLYYVAKLSHFFRHRVANSGFEAEMLTLLHLFFMAGKRIFQ